MVLLLQPVVQMKTKAFCCPSVGNLISFYIWEELPILMTQRVSSMDVIRLIKFDFPVHVPSEMRTKITTKMNIDGGYWNGLTNCTS